MEKNNTKHLFPIEWKKIKNSIKTRKRLTRKRLKTRKRF